MIDLLPLILGILGVGTPESATVVPGPLERTAVVIALERRQLPELAVMQTWFIAGGERQRVLAVEKGPAEVVVVRDPGTQQYLDRLAVLPAIESELRAARIRLQTACNLGEDVELRFVSPMAAPVSRTAGQMCIMMRSPSFRTGEHGFLAFVNRVPKVNFVLRVSDAVWMAGHELHATGRRRAVLTWVDGRSQDESMHSPASVPTALEQLQVPNFVWSFGPGTLIDTWGGRLIAEHVGKIDPKSALERFNHACAEVRAALDAQRVVWIEGKHAPSEIHLAPEADGIHLAGSSPSEASATESEIDTSRMGVLE